MQGCRFARLIGYDGGMVTRITAAVALGCVAFGAGSAALLRTNPNAWSFVFAALSVIAMVACGWVFVFPVKAEPPKRNSQN